MTSRTGGARAADAAAWVLGAVMLLTGGPIPSAQGISRDEALRGVFPGAEIRAEQLFLTAAQLEDAKARARVEIPSGLVARYLATRNGQAVGRAYVDTHTVRTKKESLLISLDADGRVLRVDITAFLEPTEYRASDPWLRQYRGRTLTDDLAVNRAIRPIAGATLTARAASDAVRRVLAIDQVVGGSGR